MLFVGRHESAREGERSGAQMTRNYEMLVLFSVPILAAVIVTVCKLASLP
jgi:hypothetical protein